MLIDNLLPFNTNNQSVDDIRRSINRIEKYIGVDNLKDSETVFNLLCGTMSNQLLVKTIETIVTIMKYRGEEHLTTEYTNLYEDALDILISERYNSELSNTTLFNFFFREYPRALQNRLSYSHFRNFIISSILIFENPLPSSALIRLRYDTSSELFNWSKIKPGENWVLIHDNIKPCFVFKKTETDLVIKPIKNNQIVRLLKEFIIKCKRHNTYIFTSASGQEMTLSNLCNAICSYTNRKLGLPIKISELKRYSKDMPLLDTFNGHPFNTCNS
mgnify:CR=1 FL=1